MSEKVAVIIGGGPAGLTAAYELLERTEIRPIVLEKADILGGLARTENYRGNRIDIGGHRFFSKSDRVMEWWLKMLPLQALPDDVQITYQRQSRDLPAPAVGPDPECTDAVMLVRKRATRIYWGRKFFTYPITLSRDTLAKLGPLRALRIGLSYLRSVFFPIRPETSLEEFFINRFGRELYRTFFKAYTEKVWGVACHLISAEWGAQRIKGLSIGKALAHFFKKLLRPRSDLAQKDTETSLIENFLYPKLGPGQMWETVADKVQERGGQVLMGYEVAKLHLDGERVTGLEARHLETGAVRLFEGDYFFSTMPVRELVRALDTAVPEEMRAISEGLIYRDFLTVGLLL
jgi:protoporphyrinogen oxidase